MSLNQNIKPNYKENKEEYLAYLREKITCNKCNCEISRSQINAHNKTKKHLGNLEKYNKLKDYERLEELIREKKFQEFGKI